MALAFKRKNLETSFLIAVILVVTCFSMDLAPLVKAQSTSVTLSVSPVGSGSIRIYLMETKVYLTEQ